jgi:Pyrimidine dimer DNA glycosylase
VNIFLLDVDIDRSVAALCDAHCSKMVLETAQLLSTAAVLRGHAANALRYQLAHPHHPCTRWAAASAANYGWLARYGAAIGAEFECRFGKSHKSSAVIAALTRPADKRAAAGEPVSFVLAIKPEYRRADYAPALPLEAAVLHYRDYYRTAKLGIAKWGRGRAPPAWWVSGIRGN